MPYATSSGRRLYYECAGEGFPILLHHGFAQTAQSWRDAGWIDLLSTRRRVVAFDILGHGRSDAPHDIESYRMRERLGDLDAVAEAADAPAFDMLGFSLGGRVALALAERDPRRVRGLIVGGMHARATRLTADRVALRARTLRKGSARALRRAIGQHRPSPVELPDPDPEALALSDEGLLDWPGVAAGLKGMRTPALFFSGEHDRMVEWIAEDASSLPGAAFHCSAGVDHLGAFERCDLSGPPVADFLDRLDRGAGR